jgi:AraC family transcriptional regulator
VPHFAAPTAATFGTPEFAVLEAGPFRVSRAEFGGELRIPSHYHAAGMLSVVLAGRFLQRFPSRECDCREGGVIVKPPEERHEDEWLAARSRHVIVELDTVGIRGLGPVRRLFDEVFHRRDAGALGVARRIDRELRDPDDLTPLAVHGLVLEMVAGLARLEGDAGRGGVTPAWLTRVRDLLHARYADPPSLDEVASEVGVHPGHLSRSFSRFYGASPTAYLRTVRLEAARRELTTTDRPIAEIAHTTGFSDQSHLTRQLKRATGFTPRALRRAEKSGRDEGRDGRRSPRAGRPNRSSPVKALARDRAESSPPDASPRPGPS